VNPQLAAWFRVLRAGESDPVDDERALHLLVYGGRFDSLADHPRRHFDLSTHVEVPDWRHAPPNSTSSAAGMFQITETTWNDYTAHVGPCAFDEAGQTACTLWLISRVSAVSDITAGDLTRAVVKCQGIWESLQKMPMTHIRALFAKYGGIENLAPGAIGVTPSAAAPVIATPAAPAAVNQPKRGGIMGGLVAELLPEVLQMFAPLAQEKLAKITGLPVTTLAPFTASVMAKVQEVTGQSDPLQAVAAFTAKDATGAPAIDPDKLLEVQQHALDFVDKDAALIDKMAQLDRDRWAAEVKSQDAAAARVAKYPRGLVMVVARYVLAMGAVLILVLGVGAVVQAFYSPTHDPSAAVMTLLAGLGTLAMRDVGSIVRALFGAQPDSAASDAAGDSVATINRQQPGGAN